MSLDTRTVPVAGTEYEVREQPMRVLLPIMEGSGSDVLVSLMRVSVHRDGAAMGDGVLDLGYRAFAKLMEAVKEVHGLGEDNPGNAG
jgi:hypothetical protein